MILKDAKNNYKRNGSAIMTEKRFRPKIRWKEQNTPIMKGHMHINVWIHNYTAKLPKIRKYMITLTNHTQSGACQFFFFFTKKVF